VTGTLETISGRSAEAGLRPPALLVVGDVVRLREKLDWFERKPLLGRGVVVTRAREQASDLLRRLEEAGACCYQFPTIAVHPLQDYGEVRASIRDLQSYDWLVFTSVNGVSHFWGQLGELGLDTRALGGLSVAAIGPATAESLRERGVQPDFVPERYVAESVIQGLLERGAKGKRVLIPRAEKAREVLPDELAKAGVEVRVVSAYRTGTAQESGEEILQACREGRVHYVTFTSSSTVENFFRLVAADELRPFVERGLELACIGPVTGRTLEGYGFRPHIMPGEYTIPALARALVERSPGGRAASR
jgi:uroporphyrinogen III methyltransferase/synthase